MGKFSNVLLASDFDHTLSDMSGAVPECNLEAIRYFMREGGLFTIASGRSIPMLRKKVELVPVNAPCILYNGAACYDYRTETLEFACAMPDSAETLLEVLRERCPDERIEVQGVDRHYAFVEDPRRDAYLRMGEVPFEYTREVPPRPWLKIAIYGRSRVVGYDDPAQLSPEDIEKFDELQRFATAQCAGTCTVTRSMPRIVEIGAADCDKGRAARGLAQRMGRPLLACIGDAPNDLSMLSAADFAFRPADSAAALRCAPFREVASSGEGCVASAIAMLETLL